MSDLTFAEALREALAEEMERDERVFVLGEEIGHYGGTFTVTRGLLDRFGKKRVVDTPLCESAIAGATVGAAFMGMRPVGEIMFADPKRTNQGIHIYVHHQDINTKDG